MDSTETIGSLPKEFGRYRVEQVLGEGAMGVVYLARDSTLDRQVALKVPKTDDDPKVIARFYREARAAATLRHRNICPVHDIGEIDGVRYISMAYISGRPLSALIDRSRLQTERTVAVIVRKLAMALETAHLAGVIHRDLKPANVMLDQQNEPVIMDFGIARRVNEDQDSRMTQSGSLMGSPAYMSPEQVCGDIDLIGPPSDIYSLGVFLYEFLTGELPFGGSTAAVFGQILTQEPDKPSTFRPDLDPRLEEICLKAMAKQIEDRYATMREAAKALSGFLQNKEQQPETASQEPSPVATIDGSPQQDTVDNEIQLQPGLSSMAVPPRQETVESEVQRQTSSGQQTPTSTPETLPGLRATIQSTSVKLSNGLARVPEWAKGAIGTVVVLLLVYSISLPFRTERKPPKPGSLTTNSIGMKLAFIPAGEFNMGSPDTDSDADDDEKPQHLVKITKPFYLSVYEVTQEQYAKVMGESPWQGEESVQEGPDNPASYVSWDDAVEFCRKLSEQEGVKYR